MKIERVIIIRDKTRLEQLIERFNSKAQAKFYLESSGGNFQIYEDEHAQFYQSYNELSGLLANTYKYKVLERAHLVNYIFDAKDVIIVLGQDGLLANTAKYAHSIPIIGVNPDTALYDGILLKHTCISSLNALKAIETGSYKSIQVSMAKATMNDGQTLLAFNDFYVGARSHISFKYAITFKDNRQQQSSSGIIVSTGAGSTGWLSSVYNMAHNVNRTKVGEKHSFSWDSRKLKFVVREPFLSKTSEINLGMGSITQNTPLQIESFMAGNGLVFSDGVESDFLNFNFGNTLTISLAEETACLVL